MQLPRATRPDLEVLGPVRNDAGRARRRLTAGGRWIRTISTAARKPAIFGAHPGTPCLAEQFVPDRRWSKPDSNPRSRCQRCISQRATDYATTIRAVD